MWPHCVCREPWRCTAREWHCINTPPHHHWLASYLKLYHILDRDFSHNKQLQEGSKGDGEMRGVECHLRVQMKSVDTKLWSLGKERFLILKFLNLVSVLFRYNFITSASPILNSAFWFLTIDTNSIRTLGNHLSTCN